MTHVLALELLGGGAAHSSSSSAAVSSSSILQQQQQPPMVQDSESITNLDDTLHLGLPFWLECRLRLARLSLAQGRYTDALVSAERGLEESTASNES